MQVNRDTVLNELVPHFKSDPRYFLLINDSGFGKSDGIRSQFPGRVFNFGITEQATIGIAAGMAQTGAIPVVYSISTFITTRALEQIRIDVVLRKQNVKIIGNGSGDYFEFMGECHHCRDLDKKLMRVIGMPCYSGRDFNRWLESPKGGYLIC